MSAHGALRPRVLGRWYPGLRVRMTLLSTALLAAVLLIAGAGFVGVLRSSLREAALQGARGHLAEISAAVSSSRDGASPADQLRLRSGEVGAGVIGAGRRLLAASPGTTAAPELLPSAPGTQVTTAPGAVPGSEPGDALVALTRRVSTPVGPVTVYVIVSVDDATEAADTARTLALLVLPLLVVALGATTWFVVGRTLGPVEDMRRAAEAVQEGVGGRRVPVPGREDEVARLGRTLNAMLVRLERSQHAQRRFIADAAHELRSPLASLTAQLETHACRGLPDDWAALRTGLGQDADRLHRVVEALLLLARADLSALRPHHRLVDVDEVVVRCALRARPPEPVRVVVDQVRPVQARLDEHLLERAVDNLVSNAVRHASSVVELVVVAERGRVVVTVDDDGPGVPVGERERVFDRFTRLDAARTRDVGGAGLGLAIVRDVATALGGRATLTSSPRGGARAVLELPLGAPGP